ncbi:MAG: siderophore-interacting protein [Acidimicrobiia bacterium]|nr:siderophore-interacting protein [Acidimicrobiia bacterium]MBT8216051.1 siderophore-interacting protein [Acidimicrobiia bacterium]NNL71045.1 siderophore-interacting protein [Acidimicrobiia bacterium]
MLTPRMARVTVAGPELKGFELTEPAASVRLLIPTSGTTELVIPEWTGNEFLLPNGDRPILRTFTPRRVHPDRPALDVDIVLHTDGATSRWAGEAQPGDPAAVAGPGRGYRIDPGAPAFFLAGDETAIPAIGQLLEQIPAEIPIRAVIEIAHPEARLDLPEHPSAQVVWRERGADESPGAALVDAVRAADLGPGTKVWVAGEAGSLFHIRRNLMEERALPRADVTVRGYWKHGR